MYAKRIRRMTVLAMLAAGPAIGTAGMAGAGQAPGTQPPTPTPATGGAVAPGQVPRPAVVRNPDVVFMVVPTAVATKDNAMRRGCWARIHSGTNYSGDTLVLSGPLSIADMSGPFGLNWDDKVDSIELGPKANLTVFDNEQFQDPVGQFKPGQKVPNISKALGFFDEFASVRLNCAK